MPGRLARQGVSLSSFAFPKKCRLLKSLEFKKTLDQGCKVVLPYVVILGMKNDLSESRVGIIASRKVGKAVTRNLIKRRLRESFRLLSPDQRVQGHDFVLIARKGATRASLVQMQTALARGMERAAHLAGETHGGDS